MDVPRISFMSMTKLQFICTGAMLAIGPGSYAGQANPQAGLHAEPSALQSPALLAESQPLARLAANPAGTTSAGFSEPAFQAADLDHKPKPISQSPPIYPFKLRRSGTTGSAMISFVVDTEGRVQNVKAVKFTHREFADAAVKAVSKWVFQPGQKAGKTVNTLMYAPIVFSLAEGSSPHQKRAD